MFYVLAFGREFFVGVTLVTRSTGGRLLIRFYVTCYKVVDHRRLYTANAANGLIRRTANLGVGYFLTNDSNNNRRITDHITYGRVSLLVFFESPLGPGPRRPGSGSLLELYSIRGVPFTAGVTATRALVENIRHNSFR